MRRWNDKLCPVPLTELDKQAHKMTIAYVLGKFAEQSSDFSWIEVIEGGLFEYFERLTLTDLKPQIFERIKANEETYNELKAEVYARFRPLVSDLNGLDKRFESYLFRPADTISRKVLEAAHFYATKWEFDIIERENASDYEIHEIRRGLQSRQEALADVEGLRYLALFPTYRSFVDLCGRLRFQVPMGAALPSAANLGARPHAHRGDPLVPVLARDRRVSEAQRQQLLHRAVPRPARSPHQGHHQPRQEGGHGPGPLREGLRTGRDGTQNLRARAHPEGVAARATDVYRRRVCLKGDDRRAGASHNL